MKCIFVSVTTESEYELQPLNDNIVLEGKIWVGQRCKTRQLNGFVAVLTVRPGEDEYSHRTVIV